MKVISLFLFFFFVFCFQFQGEENKALIIANENFYDNPDIIPINFKNENFPDVKKFLEEKFKEQVTPSYGNQVFQTVLLSRAKIAELDKANIIYHKKENPPFRFFDPTYSERLKKRFTTLEDLKSGYKDHKLNEMYLKSLSNEYPEAIRYHDLGLTRLGRKIPAIKITSNNMREHKPSVLFNCAHHSNELVAIEHCYDIIYTLLKDNSNQEFLENLVIWIVPIVNPDGSFLFWYKSNLMGRKNGYLASKEMSEDLGRGTDLNRNYPFKWNSGVEKASSDDIRHSFYRGYSEASEPETKAMMGLAETERFIASISFHSHATRLLFPYSVENTKNPQPDLPKELAKKLVAFATSYHPNRKFEAVKNIYSVDGTDQDYYYFKYGTIALLAETSHKNIEYKNVETVVSGFRPLWKNFLQEILLGDKIVLRVTNNKEEPIEAQVTILEENYFEGEKFTTNLWNGTYYKLVSEGREYTIKLNAEGYEEKILKINSKKDFEPDFIVLNKRK
ncbi:MAG: M14 family zinc carboxypeptidase [Leptospiraceae bacterium]|nr:M14 family zinc carboxypeptidase [Leptospiraceae bacterium]